MPIKPIPNLKGGSSTQKREGKQKEFWTWEHSRRVKIKSVPIWKYHLKELQWALKKQTKIIFREKKYHYWNFLRKWLWTRRNWIWNYCNQAPNTPSRKITDGITGENLENRGTKIRNFFPSSKRQQVGCQTKSKLGVSLVEEYQKSTLNETRQFWAWSKD